jgi:zinc transporter ZupT
LLATALLFSVVSLAAGFALSASRHDAGPMRLALDGLALGAVPTALALEVVPHLWGRLGVLAPCSIAAGYILYWFSERAAEGEGLAEPIVLAMLALHSSIDGASLAVAQRLSSGRAGAVLAAAVVVHRLPEGVVVGGLLVPRHGLRVAAAGAGILALATVAGGLTGRSLLERADTSLVQVASGLAMGALLKAVSHGHRACDRSRLVTRAVGAGLGVALALSFPDSP